MITWIRPLADINWKYYLLSQFYIVVGILFLCNLNSFDMWWHKTIDECIEKWKEYKSRRDMHHIHW